MYLILIGFSLGFLYRGITHRSNIWWRKNRKSIKKAFSYYKYLKGGNMRAKVKWLSEFFDRGVSQRRI